MEENNNTNSKAGKGLGVAGFVISLVALVLWVFVAGAAAVSALVGGGMGLAIFWAVLSLVGTILSIMGFMKAKAVNGKKGMAIAGLVIGILATILSVRTVFAVKAVHDTAGEVGKELMNKMGEELKEGIEQAMDSLESH